MRLIVLLCIFFYSNTYAQKEKLLIREKVIDNLHEAPFYGFWTEEKNGKKELKEEFKYIDDIELSQITYLSDGLKIKGYLIKPKKEGKYPCIIYNRGGNRDSGKLNIYRSIISLGKLAKEGYVVIASQYRGNGNSEGKEEFGGKDVNDVTILPDVLKEIKSADTSRIGMYGWSRGVMMTYLALTKTNKVKAVVVGAGRSDATVIDRPKMETDVYAQLIPNYWANKSTELKKRSPIYFVDKIPKNIPILMVHGNADWRVKSEESLKLALEFEKYRIPYRLIIFEGGNHGIREHKEEVNRQVLNWFNRYLKNNEKLPNMKYH